MLRRSFLAGVLLSCPVRALSFWQPVASLIAHRVISFDTRTWKAAPGPVVIHASKSRRGLAWCELPAYADALQYLKLSRSDLPLGAAVAVADMYDVVSTNEWAPPGGGWDELLVDAPPDRWAFLLEAVHRLTEPVPVAGRQGIWTVPDPAAELIEQRTPHVQTLQEQWAEVGDIDWGL